MAQNSAARATTPDPERSYRPGSGPTLHRGVDTEVPPYRATRLELQASGHVNRRSYAFRALGRIAVLCAIDATVILLVRAVFRGVRDLAVLGAGPAHMGRAVLPSGTFFPLELLGALVCGLFLLGAYAEGDRRRRRSVVITGVALGMAFLFWGRLWTDFARHAPAAVILTVSLSATILAGRALAERAIRQMVGSRSHAQRVLLVGDAAAALEASSRFPLRGLPELEVLGVVPVEARDTAAQVGEALTAAIDQDGIDTVMLCGAVADEHLAEILHAADLAGCRVLSLSRATRALGVTPSVVLYGGTAFVELTRPHLRGQQLLLKRGFDFAVTLLIALCVLPIVIVAALAVRLSSPGPIFFRQKRVGYAGRRFDILKFRSMYVDAEERLAELKAQSVYGDGRLFKMDHDPRITPVGRWLRKSSIDELPQLWNVLKGEMSLVGPRPPIVREVDLYEEHQYLRFDMKPGVTGPWQVSGRNRITSFDEVLRIESAYLDGWTLWRDFGILARTVPAVLRMDGAR